jgi:hypothetical protein
MTVFSLLQQLWRGPYDWEVIIAADGGTPYKWEQKLQNVRCLRVTTGSPQGTRDAGIRAAKYDKVLCIESHVVLTHIREWLLLHQAHDATLSFSARGSEGPEMYHSFGYNMDWDKSFWNKHTNYVLKHPAPHPIVANGHAAFLINKKFYLEHGGYFLGMRGWGGEEPELNLLVWHMGGSVWMIPASTHYHFLTPGAHSEKTDDYKRNFCIAAYEHGGRSYLDRAQQHYNYRLQITPEIEARRAHICRGKFGGNLDALRDYFKNTGIES